MTGEMLSTYNDSRWGEKLEAKENRRPDIFDFENYQKYLKEMYLYRKRERSDFSHGFMASQLHTSVSYMKHVFEGRRNISIDRISSIARLFDLKEKELNFFTILVIRDLANDVETKTYLSDTLNRLKFLRSIDGSPADDERSVQSQSVLGDWLSSAVYEMVSFADFQANPEWIRSRLVDGGKITDQEIEDLLERLVKDGALQMTDLGLKPTGRIVGSPNPFASQNFMMYQALVSKTHQVLDDPAPYQPCRFLVGSFAVDEESEKKLIEQFQIFGETVQSIVQNAASKDRVVMISNNIFNVSKKTP
jgi:uncharacterized protein (TIGR02147 family)